MQEHMILQISRFTKTTTTNVTSEWPEPIMYIHMALEITRRRKRFRTLRTFVRFLLKKRNVTDNFQF